jgi:HAMP domain-containing protein
MLPTMDWTTITQNMLGAMEEQLRTDWKEAAQTLLQQRQARLAKLAELYSSGALDKKFLKQRLKEEEILLQSELNALAIVSISTLRRAMKAAFRVLTQSILRAIF